MRVKVSSGDGCCPCESQSGCDCNGSPCFLECRASTGGDGIAELCGHQEYGAPSVPPKRYLIQTFSEDITFCVWPNTTCAGGAGTFAINRNVVAGATATHNADTCARTDAGTRDVYNASVPSTCPGIAETYVFTDAGHSAGQDMHEIPAVTGFDLLSSTSTELVYTAANMCYVSGFSNSGRATSGEKVWTLSVEDTEENAVNRAAPIGGLEPVVGGCGSMPAYMSQRGAGDFTFTFRRVQARVRLEGAAAGVTYEVTIRFFRRVLNSLGPWIFFGVQEYTVVADGDTGTNEFTPWVDIPNEPGWETKASNCSAIAQP